MSEQQQPPQPPPPPPGYYPSPYAYVPVQQPQGALSRLTWKQKIILGGVMVVLVLLFGVWNSCHTQTPVTRTGAAGQSQPQFLAPNPETIESQREAAERELAQAQANAEAARKRLENGPSAATPPANSPQAQTQQQDPDKQFWTAIRQEKWKREAEAPYAPGVGFVTRPPQAEERREKPEPAPLAQSAPQQTATTAQTQVLAPPQPVTYELNEGTIIPATLLNQLDGEFTGPVICQISENVYDPSGLHLLIPAGSKVLGEAHAVNNQNQRRLAVTFHRILMPNNEELKPKDVGLDQTGASALSGKVNNHYLQTFSMALAVGAIAGLSQIGNNGAVYSPMYGFREGVSQQTAISSEQILNRYLNRYPTITIKPGTRVKVILTADMPNIQEYTL